MKDPYLTLIENMSDDIRDIKQEVREIRDTLNTEVNQLKIDQQKCNSHWALVGKTLSWGGLSSAAGWVISLLAGNHGGPSGQ